MEANIHDWGYIALFLYSFGGGMIGLAVAGVFASTGDLNIYYVLVIAFIANFIGDQFLFTMAKNNKEYAKDMMQKHKRKIAYSNLLMKKYGSIVVFIQKYLYGIKTLVPLAMGLSNYNYRKFIIFNLLASIIWTLIVGLSAYILGDIVLANIDKYKYHAIVFVLLFIFIFYFILKRRKLL